MWPSIFGPGWVWGVLAALSLTCIFVGFLGFLLLVMNRNSQKVAGPLDDLWHRYEEGDITREEFERLRQQHEMQKAQQF